MSLIVTKPWTSQPQVPVGINWGNSLTRSLVSALDAATGTDRVTGKRLTLVSNPAKAAGVKGIGYAGNNASLGYVTIPQTLGTGLTFVLVSSSVVRTANGDILMGVGASGGNQVAAFQSGSGSSNRFVFRQTNGGGVSTRNYGTNASVSAVPAVLVATIIDSSASNTRVFWNGVLDQGSLTDGSSGPNTTYDTFALGGVKRSADTYADTGNNGALALLFNRVLTDSEIKSLSDNPWQIFAPLRRTIWVPDSGGGTTYTITPSGGIILSGDGGELNGKILEVSGGTTLGGTGSITFAAGGTTYTIAPSGGLVLGGAGDQLKGMVIIPSGGLTFAGTAETIGGKIWTPSGGVSFAGTGSMTSNTSPIVDIIGERTKVGAGT